MNHVEIKSGIPNLYLSQFVHTAWNMAYAHLKVVRIMRLSEKKKNLVKNRFFTVIFICCSLFIFQYSSAQARGYFLELKEYDGDISDLVELGFDVTENNRIEFSENESFSIFVSDKKREPDLFLTLICFHRVKRCEVNTIDFLYKDFFVSDVITDNGAIVFESCDPRETNCKYIKYLNNGDLIVE